MINIVTNMANAYTRDEVVDYQRHSFKHKVRDDGHIHIYVPFLWERKVKKASMMQNLKAQYVECTKDVLGYDDDFIYSGSIAIGDAGYIPYMGARVPNLIFVVRLDIQNYNKLIEKSKMIPLVNSVRNPTKQLVDDMYNGDTKYNEIGIAKHLQNVIQINWNDLDDVTFNLGYFKDEINPEMSEEQKDYMTKIREVDELYD